MQVHKVGFKADDMIPSRRLDVTFDGLHAELVQGHEDDPIRRAAYEHYVNGGATQRVRNMMKERTQDGADWLHSDQAVLDFARSLSVADLQGDGRGSRLTPHERAVRFVVDCGLNPKAAAEEVAAVTAEEISAEEQRRQEAKADNKTEIKGKKGKKADAA